MLVASLLHQDVKNDTVLVDRPPQPMTLALDLELHLIQDASMVCQWGWMMDREDYAGAGAADACRASCGASGIHRWVRGGSFKQLEQAPGKVPFEAPLDLARALALEGAAVSVG